jgi:DNA-binding transcriptional LysR family regulator
MTENLVAVAVFVTVVDSGSFAAAAEKLQLARSVVSRRVSALEAQLDTRLLHRTTRRLALTDAGQRFYDRASQALREMREAEREVRASRTEPGGKLVVSGPMSFGLLHLIPSMPTFRLRHPKIELDLRLDDRRIDLLRDGVDVAIRIADLTESSLVARRLAVIRHVVVAAPSYIAAHGAPADPSELTDHQCLIYSLRAAPRRWKFKRDQAPWQEVDIRGHFETNNSLALRDMLSAGLGIALIPTFLVWKDLAEDRLVQILGDWQTLQLDLSVVYPTRKHVAPAVRALITFMEERIGTPPYWDA